MSRKDDESIKWMYEGAKSNVNREDYLLGKKVDKNFEKYSDVVNEEKPEAVDKLVHTRTITAVPTGLKTTSLQTDVIRSEDPFVAVRVREETKRREVMDNPLMKLKLQKMLKDMMTSKGDKKKKEKKSKSKKKKKSKNSSSSDSSEDEDDRKSKSKRRSPSPKRARRISGGDRSNRRESDDRKQQKSSEDSRRRRRDSRSRTRSVERAEKRRRSRSNDRPRNSHHDDKKSRRDLSNERAHDRSRSYRERENDVRRRRDSPPGKRDRSPVKDRDRRRRRDSSSERKPEQRHGKSDEKRKSRERSVERTPPKSSRKRSRSSSWESNDDKPTTSKSERRYDSHVPEHLRLQSKENDRDESDSRRKSESRSPQGRSPHKENEKTEKKSYGLVEMRKRTDEEKEELKKGPSRKYEFVKFSNGRGGASAAKKTEPPRKLTDEEKAARLAEMQENAKWRDEVRAKNLTRGKQEDEEELKELEHSGYAPAFIRTQMKDACDDMTVEKRLQSTKGGIQRSHGYMDRNFAKK